MQSKLELKNIPFQSNRCTLALQMTCFKLLLLKQMVSISSLCHTFNSFATPRRVPAKCLQRRQHVPPKVRVNAATYQRPNQLQEGLENIFPKWPVIAKRSLPGLKFCVTGASVINFPATTNNLQKALTQWTQNKPSRRVGLLRYHLTVHCHYNCRKSRTS